MAAFAALRGVRAAFVFLTALPVGGFPFSREDWRWASAHFPLVGATLGTLLFGIALVTARLGPLASATVVVTASVLLTGALHEDALADTADALGGAGDRERIFAILKDSRIGAFGAIAVTLSLVLRITLLASLLPRCPALIIAVQALARTPCVWLLAVLDYVTPQAVAKSASVARSNLSQALVATSWTGSLLALLSAGGAIAALQALAVAVASTVLGVLAGSYYRGRLGGITGDLAGATVPLVECAALLAAGFLPA